MARIFRKLQQLLDVDLTSTPPADGDALVYDDGSSKWVPGAGGGSGADDQTAAEVPFTPAGNLASTDVQAALQELDTEKAASSHAHAGEDITSGTVADARIASTIARDSEVTAAVAAHEADTTSVHGIADTSALVTTARTLTAGNGLAGGGTLAADRTFSVNVDDSTIEINTDTLRVKDGGITAAKVASDVATQAELDAHVNDTSAAHAASAISADSTTLGGTGTDVQAVLEELDNGIADHLADSSAAHAASAISFTPDGSISATTVQAAIVEVRDEAGGGGAPTDATYITQTANGSLSNEQALSALSTGLVKVTTTTGVLSTAVANTDYPAVTHASRHQNGGADEISIAGLDGVSTELQAHLDDTTDAHDASAVSVADAGSYYTSTQVEAALQEVGAYASGWTTIVKPSDESVNSGGTGTTLQNDNDFAFTAVSGAVYEIELLLIYVSPSGGATPDFKFTFGEDSTARGTASFQGITNADAANNSPILCNQTAVFAAGTATTIRTAKVFVNYVGNGGTFRMLWAQNTSNANDLTLKAGSYMRYKRVL